MRFSTLSLGLWTATTALAAPPLDVLSAYAGLDTRTTTPVRKPDANGKYTLTAPGIRAQFIPYGASITNLFINSTAGKEIDIVLGFDNATYYTLDKQHPHLGGVPGRYANRIKNSTFELDGKAVHILPNEHPTKESPKGANVLHGGPNGYDWRNFTVVRYTDDSITFSLVDKE